MKMDYWAVESNNQKGYYLTEVEYFGRGYTKGFVNCQAYSEELAKKLADDFDGTAILFKEAIK